MNLHKLYLTKNECYIRNKKMKPIGIMVHSTAANNPTIKRYVGPDDGLIGVNKYGNHWNSYRPGCNAFPDGGSKEHCANCPLKAATAGYNEIIDDEQYSDEFNLSDNMDDGNVGTAGTTCRQVCVHGFIGKLADGTIATYQTLPLDICGWHSGNGSKGNANFLGYIGFEICEDDRTGEDYFNAVYQEAAEFCAYICKLYNLDPMTQIIDHKEGNEKGIACNHGDVRHWFPKFGKSMDTFRAHVKELLDAEKEPEVVPEPDKEEVSVEFKVNNVVKFKDGVSKYYTDGPTFSSWVSKCEHVVTQVTYKGKKLYKNGDECVLLGKRLDDSGKLITGVNTWASIKNLELLKDTYVVEDTKEEVVDPIPTPDPVPTPEPEPTPEPDPIIPEPEDPKDDIILPDVDENLDYDSKVNIFIKILQWLADIFKKLFSKK